MIPALALFQHERDQFGQSAMARDLRDGIFHSRGVKNSPVSDTFFMFSKRLVLGAPQPLVSSPG